MAVANVSKTRLTLLRLSDVRIANITKPTYGMVKSYADVVILRDLMMTSPMGIVVTEKGEKKMFFVRKKKYDELERQARVLEKTIAIIEKQNTELKAELAGEMHMTTPLCKGCVNCIETGVGYFSHGLEFKEYECKLNCTCKDYIDCIEE